MCGYQDDSGSVSANLAADLGKEGNCRKSTPKAVMPWKKGITLGVLSPDPSGAVEGEFAVCMGGKEVPERGSLGPAEGVEHGVLKFSLMVKIPGPVECVHQEVVCPWEVRRMGHDVVVENPVPKADGICAE